MTPKLPFTNNFQDFQNQRCIGIFIGICIGPKERERERKTRDKRRKTKDERQEMRDERRERRDERVEMRDERQETRDERRGDYISKPPGPK